MAWYKAWLDTRWRFFAGLAIVLVTACWFLMIYEETQRTLQDFESNFEASGRLAAAVMEAIEAQRTFPGYVWYALFSQNLSSLAVVFAAILGTGSPLSRGGRGVLFSLSLPASRNSWVAARAGTGLAELLGVTLIPSLALPLIASALGRQYAWVDALVHGGLLFVGSSVFFGVAVLLAAFYSDPWRPVLITCFGAVLLQIFENGVLPAGYGVFAVMSGATYFEDGSFPWIGMVVSVALTAGLLYAATAQLAKRDF
jgi:hypothetical protein